MSALPKAAAMAGLMNVTENAAEDLETIAAIMIHIGNHVPHDVVQPDWFAWFGRQMEKICEDLGEAARGARS